MMVSTLLPAALLLLLLPGTLTTRSTLNPLEVEVRNSVMNTPIETFGTQVVFRGILLGALNRLMDSNANFTFTYSEDSNYGPFLESVNGVAGNDTDRTYWELLVETPDHIIERPNVGIGCYIPEPNEKIILNFTTW